MESLSPQQLAHFNTFGFVHLRALFTPEEVETLSAEMATAHAAAESRDPFDDSVASGPLDGGPGGPCFGFTVRECGCWAPLANAVKRGPRCLGPCLAPQQVPWRRPGPYSTTELVRNANRFRFGPPATWPFDLASLDPGRWCRSPAHYPLLVLNNYSPDSNKLTGYRKHAWLCFRFWLRPERGFAFVGIRVGRW